jgi:hypothetical protein
MRLLETLGLTKGEKMEDPTRKAHDVVESVGPGSHTDRKKYDAYVRTDARVSAHEVVRLLGIRNATFAKAYEELGVQLGDEVHTSSFQELDRVFKGFLAAQRPAIYQLVSMAGGTVADVNALQLRHIMPSLVATLKHNWSAAGFRSEKEAIERLELLVPVVSAMSAGEMGKLLAANHLLVGDGGAANNTATFIESGALGKLHDPSSVREDDAVLARRERTAAVLVSLAHLLWKVVEVNRVAHEHWQATNIRDEAGRERAIGKVRAEIDDNFKSMQGVFVNMFKRGTKNVAIGADTQSVGLILALVEAGKGLRGAQGIVES